MMTVSTTFNQDVRIGFQVVVEGEKLEVDRFLTLLSLFLEVAIPALVTVQAAGIAMMAIMGGLQDGLNLISNIWGALNKDLLLVYWGLRLSILLVGVLKDEISRGTGSDRPGRISDHSPVRK